MLLARCVDSRSDFLETAGNELAGTSLYMFLCRFIEEMFSVPSAIFLFGRAFVCFELVWLFTGFRKFKQNLTATATSTKALYACVIILCLFLCLCLQSRPQSLRSFWPAAGIESSGSNHYERTKEIIEFWLSGSLRICIYGACLKWLLPELSIPAAGQKDRRLWGRDCFVYKRSQDNNVTEIATFCIFERM